LAASRIKDVDDEIIVDAGVLACVLSVEISEEIDYTPTELFSQFLLWGL